MAERVFKLDRVVVRQIGQFTQKEDRHLLRFTLFYPRPGTPKLETLKKVGTKLKSNKARVFKNDFLKQIVFKEKLEGIGNLYLGKAAEITNDALFEDENSEGIIVVGRADIPLNAGTLPNKLRVDLTTPNKLQTKAQSRGSRKGGANPPKKITVPKGSANGSIELSIEPL